MKVEKLDIQAFGSLREVSLDFSGQEPCVHVIYGPNEAGKSTALRALSGLFFGIPHNTPDAHTVPPPALRIGALVRDVAGRELYVLRRKGRVDTLRTQDDKSALPAEEAAWLTAGIHPSAFATQFGLTFDTLHRGAEELLGSGGDLGQSLFAAAVNGGQVRRVLEQLERDADALFRPRGSKMRLNAAIAQFELAKKRVREMTTKADVFKSQQAEVDAAELACEQNSAELTALRAERAKLERLRTILPLLARQRSRQQERQALGQVVMLPSEAAEERKRTVAARREAQVRLEHAQGELAQLRQREQALEQTVIGSLAELSESGAERLRDRLSVYRDAMRKLPNRKVALERARAEVERASQALSLSQLDPSSIERLRLPKSQEVRIREQLRQGEAARAELQTCQRKLEDKRDQLERARRKLAQVWSSDAEQLPLLARASLPSEELCAHFEQRLLQLDRDKHDLDLKRQSVLQQLEQNERGREELSLIGTPPSGPDLQRCRAKRDAALASLRKLLLEEPDVARAVAYVDRAVSLGQHADELADHMRSATDRVTRAANLASERTTLNFRLENLQGELKAYEAQAEQAHKEWEAHFSAVGVKVRLPRETLRLVGLQREVELLCEQLERELAAHERAFAAATEAERVWAERWGELVSTLDMPQATSAAELETLLADRAELLQRYDAARAIEAELAALDRELRDFEEHTAALCTTYLPELVGQPADEAAERLVVAHRQTHTALRHIEELAVARQARIQAAEQAQLELEQAERRLRELMQAAAVEDPAALEQAELKSIRARELDAELARDAADLAAECGGQDAEALVAEAGMTLDQVRVRLDEIHDDYERLDEERSMQNQQLASKRLGLLRLHEQHGAIDAASEAALQLEEVRTLSETYLRLKLAAALLRREIEHYRERNRGPVLEAAASWFSRLTLSAYEGLDVDYDERDQPVLTCVRNDEHRTRLSLPGLSTGTRDQLFLALRLASIQHLGSQRELMPLILDDILVHFDDERSRAALQALSEFASTTQVLFFTHHEHLCELAVESLPPERLRIHSLPAAANTQRAKLASR